MKLLELENLVKAQVEKINIYNHECRLHGIKPGVKVVMVYQYRDMVVVVLNDRETVTIPKIIAVCIEVDVLK